MSVGTMNVQVIWPIVTASCLAIFPTLVFGQNAALWQRDNRAGWEAFESGRLSEAEQQFKSAVHRAEPSSPQNMRLAISLSGLANVYQTQGRYAEAEPLYNRSLAIAEKAMGSNNRGVAAILDKLAAVCHALGQHGKAESMYKRALAIREEQWDGKHPLVISSLNSLASLYAHRAQYGKAEPLFRRALKISHRSPPSSDSEIRL